MQQQRRLENDAENNFKKRNVNIYLKAMENIFILLPLFFQLMDQKHYQIDHQ